LVARRVGLGWPALLPFARLVVCRALRALHISPLHAPWHARFIATWRLSPANRFSRAGHHLRGIAGHSKQRYRAGQRRRNLAV